MVHIGKNTRSNIVSKGVSAGRSQSTYRGLVKMGSRAREHVIIPNVIHFFWEIYVEHIPLIH